MHFLTWTKEWKKNKDIEVAYKRKLSKDDVTHFQNAMQKDYYFQMYYDDMPIWGFIGKVEKEGKVDPSEYKYFLFKHIQVNVSYNKDRVIEIVSHMDPQSLVDLTKEKEVEVEFMYTEVEGNRNSFWEENGEVLIGFFFTTSLGNSLIFNY